ncbi:RHS repeat-associated core domain-containing protein [Flavobacterium sp. NKUCC04_CG]|uniref:RHS repeat-associated core domain-containing protein n=1 Tax=Flavobacterium sp. NKUCC04_CG TaxID=2842121 RepID=UPI002104C69B|nr:RHS repeat-associated core domain-containing protein [Flavobacterium sp. NKUCC04_CG]
MSYSDTNGDALISPDEVLSENNYYPFGLQHQGDNPAVAQANKAAEKYKYNAKEFQDELGINLYDYGARNYDAAMGRWFNVDPLAEQFPGWTPYHYVHNNPINLIDPTGMSAKESDGWIEHATNKGDKLLTYDAEIDTKQQAIDKGYRNVKTVSESLSYNGTSGFESYNLNENGLVSDNLTGATTDVGFSPMRTGDGYYISENNPLKSFGSGLQEGGDALTYTGLSFAITGYGAPVGGAMMAIGGAMGLIGTGIESVFLATQGQEKKAMAKFGISLFFARSGSYGVQATERAIGKGLDKGSTTLINGINLTLEKTIGAETEKMLIK